MPVFGVIRGYVVTGVIDEVIRKEAHTSSARLRKRPPSDSATFQEPKRRRTIPGPAAPDSESSGTNPQPTSSLSSVLDDDSEANTSYQENGCWNLHLSDTKARRSETLPSDDSSLPARIQMMIYHRLLSGLLGDFEFSSLWTKAEIDPSEKFSESFTCRAGLMVGDHPERLECLRDLVTLWFTSMKELDVACVDPRLALKYRSQKNEQTKPRKGKGKAKEEVGLATTGEPYSETSTQRQSLGLLDNGGSTCSAPIRDPDLSLPEEDASIIGTKKFLYSAPFLSQHLDDVLEWWEGYREPRGVPIEHAGTRCSLRSCKFSTECEWRKRKAQEFGSERHRFQDVETREKELGDQT
ncbi:hypothetical protein V5O48_000972 [Marasmius crinis-equi]|uniref:Uncharacterized protein n=1 Tax=Marasmius crinis-equi TaxID=585013 RepID=A0ABR3FZV7_9AGAR